MFVSKKEFNELKSKVETLEIVCREFKSMLYDKNIEEARDIHNKLQDNIDKSNSKLNDRISIIGNNIEKIANFIKDNDTTSEFYEYKNKSDSVASKIYREDEDEDCDINILVDKYLYESNTKGTLMNILVHSKGKYYYIVKSGL